MSRPPFSLLYVSHLHPPADQPLDSIGGMQSVSVNLLRQLRSSGRVTVVPYVQEVPWRGIELATAGFLASGLRRIPRLMREHDVKLVLFSSMVTASLAPYLKWRGIGVPLVAINHGQDVTLPSAAYQRYVPSIFKALDRVISVSSATRGQSLARGLDASKASVLPNGIEERFLMDLSASAGSRRVLSELLSSNPGYRVDRSGIHPRQEAVSEADRPVLITVGRMVRRKGHAWFIREVLPLVETPVDYVMIGEGPELDDILAASASLGGGVHHRIFHLGRQADATLRMAYSAADLFVMPNIPVAGDMEGFGVVLLEANLSGTPAIATDLEGIRDVVMDGVNGYRIPVLDAASFAGGIGRLIAPSGREELASLQRLAQSHVRDRYLWPAVAEEYLDLLDSMIGG